MVSQQMVIVGGGQAGARAAQTLRAQGWRGGVAIVSKEEHLPYERPPLSKDVLLSGRSLQDCLIHPPEFYTQHAIKLHLATEAVMIDRQARRLLLSTGEGLPYHRLLLAMGATPRKLSVPGTETTNIIYLRTMADAMCISNHLQAVPRCVVIGGGLIGLEVAASARGLGCEVCVVEATAYLVGRAVPKEMADRLHARHVEAGVQIILGAQVERIERSNMETHVYLNGGIRLRCDVVIVGIGAVPITELASESGLAVDDGVLVDSTLRTEDPAIHAAGDACRYLDPALKQFVRQENWKNAEEQGRVAARNMLGAQESYTATPWFWSDQFELTLQVAGVPSLGTWTVERRLGSDSFVVFHMLEDGRIAGVSSLGVGNAAARDVRLGQLFMQQQLRPDPVALRETKNLKSILQPAVQ
jgi:3-phenylpropionate/trans-cinnamate dioxygenase ferredoxin reductase subunit